MMFAWIVLLGCPHGDPVLPPPPTGDSGEPPAACEVDPQNLLRVNCALERDGTGSIEVRVTPDGGETVAVVGDPESPTVDIVVLDLLGATSYRWEVDDRGTIVAEGTIALDALPDLLRPTFQVSVDNGPSSIDRVLFPLGCGFGSTMYVVDADGRVRWYQTVEATGFVSGFDYTDRGTILAVLARSRVLEWELDGRVIIDASRTANGLERVPHHAVIGRQGRVLVLDTMPVVYPDGLTYLVDGVSEVSGDIGTHVWDIAGLVDPQGLPEVRDQLYWAGSFPGAEDFAHENSIDVLDDGDWLISLKHLDTILRIDGAGQVRWSLTGAPNPAVFTGPPLTLGSTVGLDPAFQRQHHPNMSPWGTMLVVDNGLSFEENTRVLEIRIDEALGLADVIREWDLGVACPVQSSAFGLPDGTILATCARTRELFELDDTGIRRRTMASCTDVSSAASFVRAQPMPRITGYVR